MRQWVLFLLIELCLPLVLLATTQSVQSATSALPAKNLQQIQQQMSTLQQQLQEKKQTYTELQQQLQQTETQYGNLTNQLLSTDQQLTFQHSQLVLLQNEVNRNQEIIKRRQLELATQLRAAYMLGDQPYLKLVLDSKQNFSTTSEILYYFHYLTQYQISLIEQLKQQSLLMQHNEEQLQQHYQALKNLENTQRASQIQLATLKENRSQLITQIHFSIKSKKQQLQRLEMNHQQLENTLTQLHDSPVHPLINPITVQENFGKLEGQLPWPTPGKIAQIFGAPMDQSELKWDGVLINAKQDQPVYAIADGKIVFSKWLAGYGLLIIINHGDGYMTLYGRNHNLYKKMGDTVHAGDLIAHVGQSGGYIQPQLYFAIRHNAQPLDPSLWCR